jgi:hypothetical protein
MDRKVNFTMGSFSRSLIGNNIESSIIYCFAYSIMLVPPGPPFTALETLFLPFNQNVWLLFLSMFVIGFTAIWTTQRRFKHRKFGILENHKTPYLNMVSIFVGGSVATLPKGNLARYLLAHWIFFCLVVRTLAKCSEKIASQVF